MTPEQRTYALRAEEKAEEMLRHARPIEEVYQRRSFYDHIGRLWILVAYRRSSRAKRPAQAEESPTERPKRRSGISVATYSEENPSPALDGFRLTLIKPPPYVQQIVDVLLSSARAEEASKRHREEI